MCWAGNDLRNCPTCHINLNHVHDTAPSAMHACVETTDAFKMERPPTFSAVLDIFDNISDQYMGMQVHQREAATFHFKISCTVWSLIIHKYKWNSLEEQSAGPSANTSLPRGSWGRHTRHVPQPLLSRLLKRLATSAKPPSKEAFPFLSFLAPSLTESKWVSKTLLLIGKHH